MFLKCLIHLSVTLLFAMNLYAARPIDDLVAAVTAGDIANIKQLIAAKVDLNAAIAMGTTPLYVAAEAGNPEITKLLLKAGVDVNDGKAPSATRYFYLYKSPKMV